MGQVLDDWRVLRLRSWFPLLENHVWLVVQSSQFSDLPNYVDKYTSRLKQLGKNTPAHIHSTTQEPWPSKIIAEESSQGRHGGTNEQVFSNRKEMPKRDFSMPYKTPFAF